jgi:subtilisin family serine protease
MVFRRCGNPRRMGSRSAALTLTVLAALISVQGTNAAERRLPCGIAQPLDQILNCDAQSGARPSAPSSAAGAAGAAAAAPPAVAASGTEVAAAQAVHTVPHTPRYATNLLLVKFARTASRERTDALLRDVDATIDRSLPAIGVHVIRMAPARREEVLARLRQSRLVADVERSVVYEGVLVPNDDVFDHQWGLRRIGLPLAWDLTTGSSSVAVAVLDTGVNAAHPDLKGAVLPGRDIVNNDDNPTDDQGHGTSVAGIIAARTNNFTGQAGVCWSCSILPVKVLDASGSGDTSLIAAGIIYAADQGAEVINLSLGGVGTTDTLEEAVAYARSQGAVVVAAAGNEGSTEPFYPAASPGVLSVAASDESDKLYSWSNRGGWVKLAAPGCDVATTLGGAYEFFCGTSAATPVVSGLVALARSAKPDAPGVDVESAVEDAAAAVPTQGVAVGRVDAPKTLAALAVSPERGSFEVTGTLTRKTSTKTYALTIGAGTLSAILSSTAKKLTLKLLDRSGKQLAKASGVSPVRLERALPAGTVQLSVSGSRDAAFTLSVSYSKAAT